MKNEQLEPAVKNDYFDVRDYITNYTCEPEEIFGQIKFKHSITFELPKNISLDFNKANDFEIIQLPNYDQSKNRILAIRYSMVSSPFLDLKPKKNPSITIPHIPCKK